MALHLAGKGDHRSLVAFVEKWAETGEPTVSARIAQGRALLELRMLDKATNRVRDLAEATPANTDALLVVGEAHLLRGWNREARKVAERGLELLPNSVAFRTLLERAAEAPTDPDDEAVEPDQTPPAELIRVAEQYMAQGAFVRARTLLERVRRKVPDHRWARDLLWALDGDFGVTTSLADLCERLGPDMAVLPEVADEPEHTESARPQDLDLEDRRSGPSFPALFRNLGGPQAETSGTEPELTAVSAMAPSGELASAAPDAERTDPGGDDTQIVRIQQKKADPSARRAAAADADAQDTAVNLANLRVPTQAKVGRDYATGGDDEDDALIVHTRREDSTEGPDRTADSGLTEELEIEKKATQRGAVEDAHWAATPLAPPRSGVASPPHRRVDAAAQAAGGARESLASKAPPASPTPVPAARSARPSPAAQAVSWWVMIVFGLFGFAGVVFMLLVIVLAIGS